MKKEKKKYGAGRIALFWIIGLLIGAGGMCVAFYALENHTDINWHVYIEETLVPNAMAIVAAIATALLALKPIITNIANTVTAVVGRFKQVTSDVNETVKSSARSEEEVYQSRLEIAAMREEIKQIRELATLIPGAVEAIADTRQRVNTNSEMSRLAFGSMNELVKNGAARQIMEYTSAKEERSESNNENSEEA